MELDVGERDGRMKPLQATIQIVACGIIDHNGRIRIVACGIIDHNYRTRIVACRIIARHCGI